MSEFARKHRTSTHHRLAFKRQVGSGINMIRYDQLNGKPVLRLGGSLGRPHYMYLHDEGVDQPAQSAPSGPSQEKIRKALSQSLSDI